MNPLDQLAGIAKTAEECGFSSIALPDSLFFMENTGGGLPVHPGRVSDVECRDPLGRSAHRRGCNGRGDREDRVLHTQVLKLGSRNPVLLARQVGSVAALDEQPFRLRRRNRLGSGRVRVVRALRTSVGAHVWTEMIDVLKLILGGGMVEYHGDFFDFRSPADEPGTHQAGSVLRRRPHRGRTQACCHESATVGPRR